MISEVCPKCQCYIIPPNPWVSSVPPKMCECKSRQDYLLERILEELKEIKDNMPHRRLSGIGPR